MDIRERLKQYLKTEFAEVVIREECFRDQDTFYIKPEAIFEVCKALYENDDFQMRYLSEMTSFDWLGHEKEKDGRFEVVYILYSIANRNRLTLKVNLPADKPNIFSITDIFAGANWLEREIFDLMGIEFEGHPNLKKILTPDELDGYPLRKDYPLTFEQPYFSWNKNEPPEVIK